MDTPTAEHTCERQMGKERRNMGIALVTANGGIGANAARKVYTMATKPMKPTGTEVWHYLKPPKKQAKPQYMLNHT